MRLFLAIMLAAIVAALATVAQGDKIELNNQHSLQVLERENANSAVQIERTDPKLDNQSMTIDDNSGGNWNWVLEAINKVLFYVLFGWAAGRIFMQFRRWFVVAIGILVVANFIMVQTGLVEITFQYENVQKLFQDLKIAVMNFGLVEFLSVLIGLWAGVSGYFVSFRGLSFQQRK